MSTSQRLALWQIRAVYELLQEVVELGSSPRRWREHALLGLCRLTGARVGLSLELQDLLPGKTPSAIDPVAVGFEAGEMLQYVRYMQSDTRSLDPSNVALAQRGTQRRLIAAQRQELVSSPDWYRSPMVSEARRASNVDSFICSLYQLSVSGATTGFILYRNWNQPPFDDKALKLLRLFHVALLKKLLGAPPLHFAEHTLPPHLQNLLRCLLQGQSAKEAAADLHLRVSTVKTYMKSLYRRLGVESRGQLMAQSHAAELYPRILLPHPLQRYAHRSVARA